MLKVNIHSFKNLATAHLMWIVHNSHVSLQIYHLFMDLYCTVLCLFGMLLVNLKICFIPFFNF